MADITLYHNPNCSKSRGAKEILEARGINFEVVEYLKAPLDEAALRALLDQLPEAPAQLVRKDSYFKELGLDAASYESADAVASLLVEHPRLMQRPVGVRGNKAVIARPSELIEALLD
ncbi:MAG: arsenate reductase family protein [Pseudomonadota bacterium]